ncbi:mRNA capping nucleoside-triphosphatase [Aspergillus heteromorphus CBS 117.55]|uniref:mRNA-capping enzyme subunit beta n=1 Tax=Aspergillus heteromorphus CBS 117.55 TaxID=1448321 RepID=A0A317WHR2_9EURO|nr:mRNA capping nucleoside-triphosphatase [Aspergillus heteromorphus CBS 117.55]PWY86024.1 mRNA capping nucleoside-triphosphatase [Aspergillus heteromorphus CBS 117.55]
MDLRTIMNSDIAGNANPPPPPQQSPSQAPRKSSDSVFPPRDQLPSSSSSSYPSAYPAPPPPPQQRPHASPERSSSYGSLESPYTYHPSSAVKSSAQSQRAPSPPAGPYGSSASRDSFASVAYNPQQQSPVAHQRSQSIQEPPSAGAPQSFSAQHFSPPAQGSLPGTPRGSAAAIYTHQSPPSSARPQSSGRDSLSNRASSPWVGPDAPMHMSPTAVPRPSRADSRVRDQTPRQYSSASERRESDESVSPKTTFAPGSRPELAAGRPDPIALAQSNQFENGIGLKEANSHPPAHHPSYIDSSPRQSIVNDMPMEEPPHQWAQKTSVGSDSHVASSPQPPMRKRRRFNEPPIYAQRSVRTKGRCPPILDPIGTIKKHQRNSPTANPWLMRQQAVASEPAPAVPPVKVRGESTPLNDPSTPQRPPEPPQAAPPAPAAAAVPAAPTAPAVQVGSLGPWEPSITGFIPHEEITKLVCDFLFQHVVLRNDAIAAPAGAAATAGQMPIIEVEAKMGQLIDMDRGERMVLPILTESVINKDNPRFRTAFESTMTVAQHRAMNNFLNEAVKMSMPQSGQGRIPLSYAHKKERDTFYEVSPNELPPVIRQNLNPRHKPKVRVTHDQRTGEVLAKIVKCRIADMDVHSPRTCVDWRISVNLEMSYDGDISSLTLADGRGGRGGDRNKDRMSYRHLAYQIDLTQVAKSEPPTKGEFEHELEVEISAAEIRRQGQMAITGDPKNQYEELVKGFVDNVRLLARAVPP